jgi:Sugar phosphate permease
MSQGFGGIAGAIMASIIGTAVNWRKPFEIVSVIGFLLIILYFFIREPVLGEAEPELQELIKEGYDYNYNMEFKHFKEITLKHSNILLFFQGFFMNISTGSLIWLPTLYISKIQQQGYSNKTAIIAAGYLYALFQIGGLTPGFFGYLGDKLQRKTYKGRALLTAFFVFITMPLYFGMFITPMNNLALNDSNVSSILFSILNQAVTNPWISIMFLLSFLASAAQSANTPNWLALITDVNFPEHRGTAFSIANIAGSLGRTLGNVGIGYLLAIVSKTAAEPNNYIITITIFQMFLIPAAMLYIIMSKSNVKDIREVKAVLSKRARVT